MSNPNAHAMAEQVILNNQIEFDVFTAEIILYRMKIIVNVTYYQSNKMNYIKNQKNGKLYRKEHCVKGTWSIHERSMYGFIANFTSNHLLTK